MKRVMALALVLTGSIQGTPASAGIVESLEPTALFLQAGFGDDHTDSYLGGATWNWRWRREFALGTLTGFNEVAFGRWSTRVDGISGSAWVTQVDLTPVFRLQPHAWGDRWFIEGGIGANVILPIWRSSEKRFSTQFNFGDHLAVGRYFGEERVSELAVRVEHFSNGGIDHPNPGENFIQVRYTHHL